MSLFSMLKLLKNTTKGSTPLKEYLSKVGKEAYSPEARAAMSGAVTHHTKHFKGVSSPADFLERLLFKGRGSKAGTPAIPAGKPKDISLSELTRRDKEGLDATARRMFGGRFKESFDERSAAEAAFKTAEKNAAKRNANAREGFTEAQRIRNVDQSGWEHKAPEGWAANRIADVHKADAHMQEVFKTSRAYVAGAKKTMGEAQEKTRATLTQAIKESDEYVTPAVAAGPRTPTGRPFMGIPNWIINHPRTIMGAAAIPYIANIADSSAGYAIGGPGYGGAIGWGEGNLGGRNNIFQGANVNMNFQAQQMGHQELVASSILPQGSSGTAPMMSRSMGKQFQNSAQGLTLGLHKGRHGGY